MNPSSTAAGMRLAHQRPHAPDLGMDFEPWRDEAACLQYPSEMFFPEKGSNSRPARAVCAGCPVKSQCLAWALEHREAFGIWGGMTENQRRRLARPQVPWSRRELQPCGTPAAVRRHYRRGEPLCGACLDGEQRRRSA